MKTLTSNLHILQQGQLLEMELICPIKAKRRVDITDTIRQHSTNDQRLQKREIYVAWLNFCY